MSDDQQPVTVEAELLPPAKDGMVARNEKGQFAPGHPAGLRKGSLNRVSRAMQQELAAELEAHGIDANPLVILCRIARSLEYHPAIRVQAADRLARYLAPRLMQIELEAPDATFEVETQKIRSTLRTLFMNGGEQS